MLQLCHTASFSKVNVYFQLPTNKLNYKLFSLRIFSTGKNNVSVRMQVYAAFLKVIGRLQVRVMVLRQRRQLSIVHECTFEGLIPSQKALLELQSSNQASGEGIVCAHALSKSQQSDW